MNSHVKCLGGKKCGLLAATKDNNACMNIIFISIEELDNKVSMSWG